MSWSRLLPLLMSTAWFLFFHPFLSSPSPGIRIYRASFLDFLHGKERVEFGKGAKVVFRFLLLFCFRWWVYLEIWRSMFSWRGPRDISPFQMACTSSKDRSFKLFISFVLYVAFLDFLDFHPLNLLSSPISDSRPLGRGYPDLSASQ